MNFIDALILGIVEGITEFLPVSSTGHMILVSSLLKIADSPFTKSFEIIIQLGAILAVVFLYREKIFKNFGLMYKVFIAFLPTAVIGLALYSFVKTYLLGNVYIVISALFFGGIIIVAFEKMKETKNFEKGSASVKGRVTQGLVQDVDFISTKQAIYVGLFQAIAIIPGISRSAATIIGGEIVGLSRKAIVEFSFLLAIPIMLAASTLDILKHYDVFSGANIQLLGVGFITAFVVALIAIKSFLAYVQKHSFTVFGVYRIIVSLAFLGVLYVL